jgi:hypothetical protein
MDGYQFIASILGSLVTLAWPICFVIAVWLFRERITQLLPLLRLKYKDLDLSFRLDQAEKEVKALPASDQVSEPTPEEASKFEQLVHISPRAAILERSRELEAALSAYAKAMDIPTTNFRGMLQLTRELRKHELIDHTTSALLDDLRAIRNSAAHASNAEISDQDALRFGDLANRAIWQLNIAAGAAEMRKLPADLPTVSP